MGQVHQELLPELFILLRHLDLILFSMAQRSTSSRHFVNRFLGQDILVKILLFWLPWSGK